MVEYGKHVLQSDFRVGASAKVGLDVEAGTDAKSERHVSEQRQSTTSCKSLGERREAMEHNARSLQKEVVRKLEPALVEDKQTEKKSYQWVLFHNKCSNDNKKDTD